MKKLLHKKVTHHGSCLCGAVKFSFTGPMNDVWFCHCQNCRKNYGMYGAFVGVLKKSFSIKNPRKLKSYTSSAGSVRSFCRTCGSPITWNDVEQDSIFVLLGSLDGKVKVSGAKHIWMSDKGAYYQVRDAHPKYRIYP